MAAWNGLAIAAFADAAAALAATDATRAAGYLDAAERAAGTIVGGLLRPDGSLGRSWKDGRAVGSGVLEDYTHLADGLLALYEASFEAKWFKIAMALMDRVLAHFAISTGGFFDTADDHERLVTRPKDVQDNAVPSGNAMAARVLLRLAAWMGEGRYRDAAERAIRSVVPFVTRYPTGFAQWLSAMDLALAPTVEVAIVGEPGDGGDRGAHRRDASGFPPQPGLGCRRESCRERDPADGRAGRHRRPPTAYVCRAFACRLPVGDARGAAWAARRRGGRWLTPLRRSDP